MFDNVEKKVEDSVVLSVANAYTRQYYLNERFLGLPQAVREEIQIMCVTFTEEIGGILILYFDEDGELLIETRTDEEDILYDEIGSRLKVKQMLDNHRDLFESLELYYKTFDWKNM